MATLVVSSIGTTGRTYSTVQLWEDAIPADLVASDVVHRGEVYNDGAAALGAVNFSAHTTDATRYIHLTAAAGQSFADNPSVRTTALTYNDATYAALQITATYSRLVQFSGIVDYFTMDRLMLRSTAGTSITFESISGCDHHTIRQCTMWNNNTAAISVEVWGSNTVVASTLWFHTAVTGNAPGFRNSVLVVGSTFARAANQTPAGNGPTALNYSSPLMRSCAVFGYTTPAATAGVGAWSGSSSHNATQAASGLPGTSNQHSVSYSSVTPFVQGNETSNDMRAISGTALAANGLLDSTNAPNDISGLARSATPTIGAWELAADDDGDWAQTFSRGMARGFSRGLD